MYISEIYVIHDKKENDRFIDIIYRCPEGCGKLKIARYKDEYFFCLFNTEEEAKNYAPCMDNREIIHIFNSDINDI